MLTTRVDDVVWTEHTTSPELELTLFARHEDGSEEQWALVGGELVHRCISYDLFEDQHQTVVQVLGRPSKRALERTRRAILRGYLDPREALEDLLLPVPY